MKLLVVFLVVLLGVWLWRQGRLADREAKPPRRPPPALPDAMVRCAVCGVHLPAAEALSTGLDHFCSPEHQRQAGR